MNTHRSAFGGRNFEYYSEDGVLAGYLAMNQVNGAATKGVYPYIKHFAVNDQECNREAFLLTFASEQAIREIYLKPFELCIKGFEGSATAVLAMRKACKNIMYTIVNSGAYAGSEDPIGGMSNMDKIFLKVNVTGGIVIGGIALFVLVHYLRKRKKGLKQETE